MQTMIRYELEQPNHDGELNQFKFNSYEPGITDRSNMRMAENRLYDSSNRQGTAVLPNMEADDSF